MYLLYAALIYLAWFALVRYGRGYEPRCEL